MNTQPKVSEALLLPCTAMSLMPAAPGCGTPLDGSADDGASDYSSTDIIGQEPQGLHNGKPWDMMVAEVKPSFFDDFSHYPTLSQNYSFITFKPKRARQKNQGVAVLSATLFRLIESFSAVVSSLPPARCD